MANLAGEAEVLGGGRKKEGIRRPALGYINAGETSGQLAAAWTCPLKQLHVVRVRRR